MSRVERTITLPSLMKSGLVTLVSMKPTLTPTNSHSLGPGI